MKFTIFFFILNLIDITNSLNTPKTSINSNDFQKVFKQKYFLVETPYNELIDNIENHKISKIYFSKSFSEVITEDANPNGNIVSDYTYTKISPVIGDNLVDISVKNKVQTVFDPVLPVDPIQTVSNEITGFISGYVVPFILISIIFSYIRNIFLLRNGNNNPFSNPMSGFPGNLQIDLKKDKENMINSNITLSSFAGSPEIFEECTEVVSYLKNGTLYKNAGAEIPRGILLEGPPGTGKTLLAKAIASEAEANFISISASEFVEVFVGVGASKIRNLFKTARENKPCIIFIDEIDSVARQRGAGINMANDEREQTLNQLLAEMDGFESNDGILIIAATNRKDVLDAAILRPGRFDRLINVPLPDKNSRRDILKVHSKNKNLQKDINIELVAELTAGFSGAQLKNLLNEAAIYAARKGNTIIEENDILNSLDKLIVGIVRKNDTRSDDARLRIAIHETGHALLCGIFNDCFELKKVTIQSTYNGAGGYTLFNEYNNITESGLYTKNLLKKRLIVAMGGKAAENIYYGDDYVSIGAVQDLKQANSLAQQMIGNYGMGKQLEAFFNENVGNGANPFLGRSLSTGYKYSEKTKELMDKESLELTGQAYDEAKRLLSENRDKMQKIVDELLEKNTIYGKEFNENFF
jgi:cell division protease FtsH